MDRGSWAITMQKSDVKQKDSDIHEKEKKKRKRFMVIPLYIFLMSYGLKMKEIEKKTGWRESEKMMGKN